VSPLSGKIVEVQLSPPEPQKSNIDAIAGCIDGVLVTLVVGVIATILPDKDDKNHYQHYRHYYTTNTSCCRINVTCLRLWWRGL
jgi:hypothetical protein